MKRVQSSLVLVVVGLSLILSGPSRIIVFGQDTEEEEDGASDEAVDVLTDDSNARQIAGFDGSLVAVAFQQGSSSAITVSSTGRLLTINLDDLSLPPAQMIDLTPEPSVSSPVIALEASGSLYWALSEDGLWAGRLPLSSSSVTFVNLTDFMAADDVAMDLAVSPVLAQTIIGGSTDVPVGSMEPAVFVAMESGEVGVFSLSLSSATTAGAPPDLAYSHTLGAEITGAGLGGSLACFGATRDSLITGRDMGGSDPMLVEQTGTSLATSASTAGVSLTYASQDGWMGTLTSCFLTGQSSSKIRALFASDASELADFTGSGVSNSTLSGRLTSLAGLPAESLLETSVRAVAVVPSASDDDGIFAVAAPADDLGAVWVIRAAASSTDGTPEELSIELDSARTGDEVLLAVGPTSVAGEVVAVVLANQGEGMAWLSAVKLSTVDPDETPGSFPIGLIIGLGVFLALVFVGIGIVLVQGGGRGSEYDDDVWSGQPSSTGGAEGSSKHSKATTRSDRDKARLLPEGQVYTIDGQTAVGDFGSLRIDQGNTNGESDFAPNGTGGGKKTKHLKDGDTAAEVLQLRGNPNAANKRLSTGSKTSKSSAKAKKVKKVKKVKRSRSRSSGASDGKGLLGVADDAKSAGSRNSAESGASALRWSMTGLDAVGAGLEIQAGAGDKAKKRLSTMSKSSKSSKSSKNSKNGGRKRSRSRSKTRAAGGRKGRGVTMKDSKAATEIALRALEGRLNDSGGPKFVTVSNGSLTVSLEEDDPVPLISAPLGPTGVEEVKADSKDELKFKLSFAQGHQAAKAFPKSMSFSTATEGERDLWVEVLDDWIRRASRGE